MERRQEKLRIQRKEAYAKRKENDKNNDTIPQEAQTRIRYARTIEEIRDSQVGLTISPKEAKFERRQNLLKECSLSCTQVYQLQNANEVNQEEICSTKDVCFDIIHSFKGQTSIEEPLECELQNANINLVKANSETLEKDNPQKHLIYDNTYSMLNYDHYVMNVETPNDDSDYDLPLLHPELIDWDNLDNSELNVFSNDHDLVVYLNAIEPIPPKISSTTGSSDVSHSQENAKLFSRKSEIKQGKRPIVENYFMETLDQSKKNNVFDGENLLEAPEDGKFDIFPAYFLERFAILIEPTEAVNIDTSKDPKILHFAASLSERERKEYMEFFKQRQINFVSSYVDMPGLNPDLIMHHLNVDLKAKPVKQKLRKMHPHIALLVKIELKKLLEVGFIRPVAYPEWVSSIVPVSKLDKSIRVCTDFKDLNKACQKDDFPLPNIDIIMDLSVGHEMFSLMDGFSGYNQIRIAPEDQEKTTFTRAWGTYYWNVMPFGLTNARATYQRAMMIIFHDMMHTFMEDYVDDILAKSYTRKEHLNILSKIFDRLERYQLRLNPKKCAFRVTSGNLLGYIISAHGIEVDPRKVKAIMEMESPKNISQLRSLQGRLQSIRRFVSQLVARCLPFTHLLHKNVPFKWDLTCEEDFLQIKEYLMSPPILISLTKGKPLLL